MKRHDEIIQMIENIRYIPVPVTEESNLYRDLGFDSLTFIGFLIEIEKKYAITFEIMEMECCLQVGVLISLVERKVAMGGKQ